MVVDEDDGVYHVYCTKGVHNSLISDPFRAARGSLEVATADTPVRLGNALAKIIYDGMESRAELRRGTDVVISFENPGRTKISPLFEQMLDNDACGVAVRREYALSEDDRNIFESYLATSLDDLLSRR